MRGAQTQQEASVKSHEAPLWLRMSGGRGYRQVEWQEIGFSLFCEFLEWQM